MFNNIFEPKERVSSGNIVTQREPISHSISSHEKATNLADYIYIISEANFYSKRFKKYFNSKQVAQNIQAITWAKVEQKDIEKYLQEGWIKKYLWFCYGKDEDWMYNTFDKNSILKSSINPDIHPGILELYESITWEDTADMEYLMKATLFKYLNPTSCQIPAIILTWAQWTGKTSFVRLMATIFWTDNVQLNVGQKSIEGRFSATGNDKLVYEYAELYTGSRTRDIALANMLKNTVLQEEISSERKYVDTKFIKNSGWYIITSNNPMPVMLDSSDISNRRYSVFRWNTPLGSKAELVYKTIHDKEIVAEFLQYLMESYGEEVSKLDTFPAHENSAKTLLASNSTSEYVDFWNELREELCVWTFVSNKGILTHFDEYCHLNGYDSRLKMKLMKSCPYSDPRTRDRVWDSQPRGKFITH